ncbi:uncharacterized protein TNCV_1770201 [Trichonephila clavipes]|nr:uncharacterized protein TNCV_1770201 [Trichonephila clavipes]
MPGRSQECSRKKIDNVEEKIISVEEKIALKVEEKIAAVDEKIEKKAGEEIEIIKEEVEENIKEQVEERIEGVAESFSLISQRVEDLKKLLLVCANKNENKILPSSTVSVSTSPVPVTASTVSVKLSTYDGKTNWKVYKTQFSKISENNGWTEGVKTCQLVASLRVKAAEILQTLPDTERLNLNSLYNALDLRFSQKYSKDYARLQMKTRLQKTGESLQEYASEVEKVANLAFSDHPLTVPEAISLQYFVDGLKDGEMQKAVRTADGEIGRSANKASRRYHQSIRGDRLTADEPWESRLLKEIEKLKEKMQTIKAEIFNQEKRDFKCWGCGGTRHLRRNCPRSWKDENTVSSFK